MKTRWLAFLLIAGVALGASASCRATDELTPAEAADALRASPGFTVRERSLVGRKLEQVLVVRRIGNSSTEVEFTWRDAPLPPGETSPLKTSMALFRKDDEGRWALAAFYKVD